MNLINLSETLPYHACVATIGFFDGVHVGHQFLIEKLRGYAQSMDLSSLLITFRDHPRKVMQSAYQPLLLSTCEEKIHRLSMTKVDDLLVLDFTPEMAKMTAWQFMKEVLKEKLYVKVLVIGYDHRFGHQRSEKFEDYVRYGRDLGIQVVRADAFSKNDIHVSSSMVRSCLIEGEIGIANQCLGYHYPLSGIVEQGFRIGSELGYPTANIRPSDGCKLVPKNGVYAVKVSVGNGTTKWWGMLNIGRRPTMENGDNRTIEVHVIDYQGDLYGQQVTLEFVSRLRDEKKFRNKSELVSQLRMDEAMVRKISEK